MYFCPADRVGAFWMGDPYWRSRGNYVVNYGNVTGNPWPTTFPAGKAPFGYLGGGTAMPWQSTLVQITDGSSNTLLMAEIITAIKDSDWDGRGDFLNDDGNFFNHQFMTVNTPNGGTDVTPCVTNSDKLMPCTSSSANVNGAARSRHPGGAHALFADGSARFILNSIDINSWRALGSMDGNDSFIYALQ